MWLRLACCLLLLPINTKDNRQTLPSSSYPATLRLLPLWSWQKECGSNKNALHPAAASGGGPSVDGRSPEDSLQEHRPRHSRTHARSTFSGFRFQGTKKKKKKRHSSEFGGGKATLLTHVFCDRWLQKQRSGCKLHLSQEFWSNIWQQQRKWGCFSCLGDCVDSWDGWTYWL